MRNVANEKQFALYQAFKKYTDKDTRDLCEIIKAKSMLPASLQEEICKGIELNCQLPLVVRQRGYSRNADAGYYYATSI